LRVATWNVWWRFGPWRERQRAISKVLRDLGADVIALQEVWSTGTENQAGLLADELGMHHAWTPAVDGERWRARGEEVDLQVGTAVLSRWPIVERQHTALPIGEMPATCAQRDDEPPSSGSRWTLKSGSGRPGASINA
jgi:endonuclease/exonuclease/phosphatase family metal-dependent hydrolase